MKVGDNPSIASQSTAVGQPAPVHAAPQLPAASRLTSASPGKSFTDYMRGFVDWVKGLFSRLLDCFFPRKKPAPPQAVNETLIGTAPPPGVPPLPSRAERYAKKQEDADATNPALAGKNTNNTAENNNNNAPITANPSTNLNNPIQVAAPVQAVVQVQENPDQAVETLTKWLTPHIPKFKEIWAKMDIAQKKTFFEDVLKRGYPITSKQDALDALNWARANLEKFVSAETEKNRVSEIHVILQGLISLCGADSTKYSPYKNELANMLDALIALQEKSDALYKQADMTKSVELLKTWKQEGFSVGSVVANAQPLKIEFIDAEKAKAVTYEFTPEAYALCSAYARSRSAVEGKLYSAQEIMKQIADKRWVEDKKPVDLMASAVFIDNYRVIASKTLFTQLKALANIQSVIFLSNTEAKTFSSTDKNAAICLISYTQQKVGKDFPMVKDQEGNLFAPLFKNG